MAKTAKAKKPATKKAEVRPDPQSGMDATQSDPKVREKAVEAQFAAADAAGQPLNDEQVGHQVRGW